jgi:chemotaxis protein MotB
VQRRVFGSEEGWLLSYADLITNLLIFFVMLLAAANISRTKMQQISQSLSGIESKQSLSSIKQEIDERIHKEGMEGLVQTKLTDDGLELSLNSGLVFDSGRADIRAEMTTALGGMLNTLVPYSEKYAFAVEGHTDSKPIINGTLFKSNWELSTERANAVRGKLEDVGVDRTRIRVEGYADTRPLPAKELEGLDEEERLARHRRVIVRVY